MSLLSKRPQKSNRTRARTPLSSISACAPKRATPTDEPTRCAAARGSPPAPTSSPPPDRPIETAPIADHPASPPPDGLCADGTLSDFYRSGQSRRSDKGYEPITMTPSFYVVYRIFPIPPIAIFPISAPRRRCDARTPATPILLHTLHTYYCYYY